jgi:hypothetical protein
MDVYEDWFSDPAMHADVITPQVQAAIWKAHEPSGLKSAWG